MVSAIMTSGEAYRELALQAVGIGRLGRRTSFGRATKE
jgi:hypothetical protein